MTFLVDNQDILSYTVSIVNKRKKIYMSTLKTTISDVFAGTLLMIFALGWIDVLWMFGVENSKEYTWWYLIHLMGQ